MQVQPVSQHPELLLGHLLDLVGGVARLDLGPERPTLDGLRQDRRRGPDLFCRRLVGGVELAVVVAATRQRLQLRVRQVLDELAQARIGAEEVLADIGAGLGGEGLEIAVEGRVHLVEEHSVHVPRQQLVPAPPPDDLDHVPAATAQQRLQLLDDLAVAPDGPVEALQIAVDDEGQVVQALARRQAERGPRLGLVELAVADEGPHPRLGRVGKLAVHEIAIEARLVDGRQRAEAHRDGRELPPVGHEPGVRVAGQTVATDLEAVVVELFIVEPALDIGAGIDSRRGVTLEEDLVAGSAVGLAAEEVVEAHLVEGGRAGKGREVTADAGLAGVRPRDHDGCVPADVTANPSFEVLVAGEPGLGPGWDRVDVGARDGGREADLVGPRPLQQFHQQELGTRPAAGFDDGIEGVQPLCGLLRINIGQLV